MKVGILGAGQLGQMLAEVGYRFGFELRFLEPVKDRNLGVLLDLRDAAYDDQESLLTLADWADVVTYEFENVPVSSVETIQAKTPIFPPPQALATAQDRLHEKDLFRDLSIPTPTYVAVQSEEELRAATRETGFPAVLKTRRFGYDGKGQARLFSENDVATAWKELGGQPLILEGFVDFDREVSLIATRARDGAVVHYPLVENHHHEGILRVTQAPAPGTSDAVATLAKDYVSAILDRLDYIGTLAVEFFQRGDDLLANEMAPRVHNSGHWSIEGALTSQFENHLRAIAGLPLGGTVPRGPSLMLNAIGAMPPREDLLRIPGVFLHDYGKKPRPGRKVGHITVVADDRATLWERGHRVRALLSADGFGGG